MGKKIKEISPEKFARKEKVVVPADILSRMHIKIPPVYYWETVEGGRSVLMTMAFTMFGMNFGESFPMEDDNVVKIDMLRKKLFARVKESLDVLVHHGEEVLDQSGNIDPVKVNEQEALRYRYDKHWDKKVAAFNQLVRIAPITQKKAQELGLLN